jgi:diguanylate cyclase (GGDEF)-like protein
VEHSNIAYAAIVDAEGEVVSCSSVDGRIHHWAANLQGPVTLASTRLEGERHLYVTRPIAAWGAAGKRHDVVGSVRLAMDVTQTTQMLDGVKQQIFNAAIIILVVAIPLGYVVIWRILIRPIRWMVQATRRFARGEFTARSRLRRTDETGELSAAFDDMADEVEDMRKELLAHNERLERQVFERTRELSETNQRLVEEMHAKEKLQGQLQDMLEELHVKNKQLKESMGRLQTMATTDPLTGLNNRRSFSQQLKQQFREAMRYSNHLTCCMIDVDHFKGINDTQGHQRGDELIWLAADVIRSSIRDSDIAARYGGDEFVLLLPHASTEEALITVNRIRDLLAERCEGLPWLKAPLTLSIGVASLHEDFPETSENLLSLADHALYEAKEKGRNRIVAHSQNQHSREQSMAV